jgi:IS30 family transposase
VPGPTLTLDERVEIAIGHERGETLEQIADRIGRAPSTVSRELRRNRPDVGPYRACTAQRSADAAARRPRARQPAATAAPLGL